MDATRPQDLRLGNWIQDVGEGEIFQVTELTQDTITAGAMTLYRAGFIHDHYIEITPEWLERFGCNNQHGKVWETPKGITFLFGESEDGFCGVITFGPRHVHFYYVHTLQNIIALTGEELTLSEPKKITR